MVVLFLEKQAMVFLLGEVALQQSGEKVDKGMDFILGETLAEEIGKLPPSGELQEAGKGLLIQLFAQAETDVLGVDGHGRGRGKWWILQCGGENAPVDTSAARPVEFTEKYLLPGAEYQALVGNQDGKGGPHEGCHDVGG